MSTEPRPSATVVLVQECAGGLRVLLVKRSQSLRFAAGFWVFPGGTVAPGDRSLHVGTAAGVDSLDHRLAAVRELAEETSLTLASDRLELFAEWLTPAHFEERYRTAFFLAPDPGGTALADGSEIVSVRWLSVADALAAQASGELMMMPPTFVTLSQLGHARTLAEARARLLYAGVQRYQPVLVSTPEGPCALYEGDAEYPASAPPEGRHRLWMRGTGWTYERSVGVGDEGRVAC